ncbi:hypothetical protein FRB90_000917 [Tulasnella sp. 427]|nr:hypothetical protein FRB90_000917 [Tulasnella sp. 427]
MSADIPIEVILEIIKHVHKPGLLALMRSSSFFYELAEPFLYSSISLVPFKDEAKLAESIVECFRTIIARPSAARAVRRLHISFECNKEAIWSSLTFRGALSTLVDFKEVLEVLKEGLARLVHLERLAIEAWDHTWMDTTMLPRGFPFVRLQHYYGPPEVADNIQSRVLATVRVSSLQPPAADVLHALHAAQESSALRALDIGREKDRNRSEWLVVISQIPSLFPNIVFLGLGEYWDIMGDQLHVQSACGMDSNALKHFNSVAPINQLAPEIMLDIFTQAVGANIPLYFEAVEYYEDLRRLRLVGWAWSSIIDRAPELWLHVDPFAPEEMWKLAMQKLQNMSVDVNRMSHRRPPMAASLPESFMQELCALSWRIRTLWITESDVYDMMNRGLATGPAKLVLGDGPG